MKTDICVQAGRRISQLRASLGISQVVLADRAGLDRKNLSRIENGLAEPGLRTLLAIANALNVTVSTLLDGCS